MRPNELEVRRIELLKDALIAEYHARVHRWNLLHQAGLAVLGLAAYASITGALTLDHLWKSVAVAGGASAFGGWILSREERDFELKLERLVNQIETMKRQRG